MSDTPRDDIAIANVIRRQITGLREVPAVLLEQLEVGLRRFPESVDLWLLRGHLIQLGADDPRWSLQDAELSYIKAADLSPSNPEPFEELGYFYDLVLDDPARAEPCFRRAIALGAGESAETGLHDVLAQLT